MNLLKRIGAVRVGDFTLTSGLKSKFYIEKFRLLERPKYTKLFVENAISDMPQMKIDYVVGMPTGGIIVAYEFANQLYSQAVFIEGKKDEMKLARGAHIEPNSSVLIVDDVLTTGGTLRSAAELISKHGANIVGYGALVDRSDNHSLNSPVWAGVKITEDNIMETGNDSNTRRDNIA